MKTLSWRDWERLSAYLDGQLAPRQRARLEARLEQEADLRQAFEALRRTRAFLRRLPARRAPHHFTLTPGQAGLRPPLPRAVPALRWAAALALLLFFCSLTVPSLPPLAAPKAAATAQMMEAASSAPTETAVSLLAAAPAETPGARSLPGNGAPSPSAEADTVTPSGVAESGGAVTQPEPESPVPPLTPWQLTLLILAMLALFASLLLGWQRQRAFRRQFAAGRRPPDGGGGKANG